MVQVVDNLPVDIDIELELPNMLNRLHIHEGSGKGLRSRPCNADSVISKILSHESRVTHHSSIIVRGTVRGDCHDSLVTDAAFVE